MPRVRRYHKMPAGLLCSVVGCGKAPLARGLCKQHYMRWHRNGDLVVRPRSGQKAGDKHTNWKGDAVSENGGRLRAQRIYKLGVCERCPKPARDRHHIDGNTANNEPENILRLCRSCHMDEDGRAEMLAAYSRQRKADRERRRLRDNN